VDAVEVAALKKAGPSLNRLIIYLNHLNLS
jgi:hypothetical protein